MSTPNPDDRDLRPDDLDPAAESPRRNSAGLLWILILLALIAAGFWLFSKRPTSPAPGAAPIIEAPVATDSAPVPAATPATDTPTDAQPLEPRPAPAVPKDRDPAPLAGNQRPDYPPLALRSGVEGSVSVRIEVDASGVPTSVRVVERSGERSRELDRAVLNAARAWRFEPALRDGKAVSGAVVVPVDFRRD